MTEKDKICYIRPKRALRRLKAAEEENITAYIYGVSGIGKTELIVRYLKQKKYQMFDAGRVSPASAASREIAAHRWRFHFSRPISRLLSRNDSDYSKETGKTQDTEPGV